jgi:hypothetical protein
MARRAADRAARAHAEAQLDAAMAAASMTESVAAQPSVASSATHAGHGQVLTTSSPSQRSTLATAAPSALSTIMIDDSDGDPDLQCTICRAYFEGPVTWPCGHTFCRQCTGDMIDRLPFASPGVPCPVCRSAYTGKELRSLKISISLQVMRSETNLLHLIS